MMFITLLLLELWLLCSIYHLIFKTSDHQDHHCGSWSTEVELVCLAEVACVNVFFNRQILCFREWGSCIHLLDSHDIFAESEGLSGGDDVHELSW